MLVYTMKLLKSGTKCDSQLAGRSKRHHRNAPWLVLNLLSTDSTTMQPFQACTNDSTPRKPRRSQAHRLFLGGLLGCGLLGCGLLGWRLLGGSGLLGSGLLGLKAAAGGGVSSLLVVSCNAFFLVIKEFARRERPVDSCKQQWA